MGRRADKGISADDRRSQAGFRMFLAAASLGTLMLVAALLAPAPTRVSAGSLIAAGDVMVSVSNGLVQEFTPAGALVQTLDTTKGAGVFTSGSAFDSSGNFYVADFNANDVSEFDPSANLIGSFGSGYDSDDKSILFDAAGNAYVGQAAAIAQSWSSAPQVHRFRRSVRLPRIAAPTGTISPPTSAPCFIRQQELRLSVSTFAGTPSC